MTSRQLFFCDLPQAWVFSSPRHILNKELGIYLKVHWKRAEKNLAK